MMWIACSILLFYPCIADIKSSKFYIWPIVLGTGLLLGIGIVSEKIMVETVLMGILPGMVLFMFSRWTKGAIGEGDAIVITALGAVLGWYQILVVLCMACFLSAGYGIWLIGVKKKGKRQTFPFVPFIMAAVLFCGIVSVWRR